jgi:hypothetical protein
MMLLVVLILTVEEVKITIHKVVQILLKITLIRVQVIKVKVITDKAILIQIQTQVVMVLMGGNSGQPTHTTKYLGWVSVDGVRKYTKMCDTVAEAQSYVDSTVNSAEVINLGFDHSIGYGLDTVEV